MADPTTIEKEPSLRDALAAAMPSDDGELAAAISQTEPLEEVISSAADTPALDRAADGKFAAKAPKEASLAPAAAETPLAAAKPTGITPGPKEGPAQQPDERAPNAWKPAVREHWAAMPAEVKAEVVRREREHSQLMQESAEARKGMEAFDRVVRPYEMFIKAENANPLQAVDNLMRTAAQLRTSPAADVAKLVAGVVKQFGVGRFGQSFIDQLDAALVGEIPREDAASSQIARTIQQQLAPVQQFMSRFEQSQQQASRGQAEAARNEVEDFLAKAEFGADVREDMADLMEVATRRGRELSLTEAYRQACMSNPAVAGALSARAARGGANQAAVARARGAAVQVTGSPAMGVPAAEQNSTRAAIENAIALHSR
jgi:hypothetical protein